MSLTVGSLFSGIGGLDLGLERAGMRVKWQAEVDPYCSRVLAKHWPDVPNLGDVTKVDWEHVERVDLICGGYPCQPFSLAGARRGSDDARHLWPHFADALRVLRPRFALLENVPGHLSLGFGDVLGDLAALGYDCEWQCVPAAGVGAPHLRYRIFVVAYPASDAWWVCDGDGEANVPDTDRGRLEERSERDGRQSGPEVEASRRHDAGGLRTALADTNCSRLEGHRILRSAPERSRAWLTEPDVGRVAHGVPSRVDRLRALGNAVVPQVAEFIGAQLLASITPSHLLDTGTRGERA